MLQAFNLWKCNFRISSAGLNCHQQKPIITIFEVNACLDVPCTPFPMDIIPGNETLIRVISGVGMGVSREAEYPLNQG